MKYSVRNIRVNQFDSVNRANHKEESYFSFNLFKTFISNCGSLTARRRDQPVATTNNYQPGEFDNV